MGLVLGAGGTPEWGRGLQHLLMCGRPSRALSSLSGPSSLTTCDSWSQLPRPSVKSFTFSFVSFPIWNQLESSDHLVSEMRRWEEGKLGRASPVLPQGSEQPWLYGLTPPPRPRTADAHPHVAGLQRAHSQKLGSPATVLRPREDRQAPWFHTSDLHQKTCGSHLGSK